LQQIIMLLVFATNKNVVMCSQQIIMLLMFATNKNVAMFLQQKQCCYFLETKTMLLYFRNKNNVANVCNK